MTALVLSVVVGGAGVARAERVPLRQVDWAAVLLSDPRIGVPEDCFQLSFAPGPCITVQTDGGSGIGPDGTIDGYANLYPDDISYGDLDGDGAEEAVIEVESGGTAGTIGFLVFREGEPTPRLVAVQGGYKLYPRIRDGLLLVSEPFYFGFEGNCCPTGGVQRAYSLRGDALVRLDIAGVSPQWFIAGQEEARPAIFAEVVVTGFYRALSDGRYEAAHALLSPAFQATHPFEAWRAGYATTRSIEVKTQPGRAGPELGGSRFVAEVLISLRAVDVLPSGDRMIRCFEGSWLLVAGPEGGPELLLDTASINPAPC